MDRETGSPRPRFWWDPDPGPLGLLLRATTAPLGAAFAAFARRRARAYAEGRRPKFRPPAPCVSIGNLVVGGVGKTPCARFVVERLIAAGRRPIVLSRGYGAKVGPEGLDEEGESLRRAVPGLVVDQRAGRREGRGDWTEIANDPSSVLVLDDGFQKLVTERDLDVLLIDASRPFGSGRCLPAGPLREPIEASARADWIVLSRCDQATPAAARALASKLARLAPGVPVLRARHAPSALLRSGAPAATLRGKKAYLLSAIGHPSSFEATVRGLGATVVGVDARRDHAPFERAALKRASEAARSAKADLVLCTSKDLPKVEACDDGGFPFDALDVRFEFLDDPSAFVAALRALPRGRPGGV